jgi:hypothetical protein
MAAATPFAFAVEFRREAAGALGRARFMPDAEAADASMPSLEQFALALAGRAPLAWDGGGGRWSLEWS